ncbi:MAG: 50S ribosomal protein L11 methyltransferase [Anaerolineae bacterium]
MNVDIKLKHYLFRVKKMELREQAFCELTHWHVKNLYEIEEEAACFIGGFAEQDLPLAFEHVEEVFRQDSCIDWKQHWELFAEGFKEGVACIDLCPYGCLEKVVMEPGPGFGDVSHPTTCLCLELMLPYVKGKKVLDVGCGSGILSLAAALMGGSHVIGLDIDKEAVSHATRNVQMNHLEDRVQIVEAGLFSSTSFCVDVALINMIESEQKSAWGSYPSLHRSSLIIVTSGIRQERRDAYLREVTTRGWVPICEKMREEWLGFVFVSSLDLLHNEGFVGF